MPRLPELEIAKRAVLEGALPQEVLEACLAEKRRARADGLDVALRDLLQERGFLSAQAWDAIEKRAATAETRGDGSGPPAESAAKPRSDGVTPSSGRLVPAAEFLGEYRLIKEIGRGAMGVVYEAIQGTLGRRVALKVLPAGSALSGVARERFLREARAVASLNHPGIIPIYDQGEERGVPFFAMELVSGKTLKDVLLETGPLEPPRAAKLAAQAARALDYAHERGVIHRDVKPDNLFVQAPAAKPSKSGRTSHFEERVLLADFGLATRLDDASLTREGTAVGTPLYMAPEQARGDREKTDHRADIYGLGATLYELLSGVPPFPGSPDTQTLLSRIREEDAMPLRARVEKQRRTKVPKAPFELPPALDAIVMRTLEKEPERRYASAGELADDLERFLRGEAVVARPAGAPERVLRFARKRVRILAAAGGVATFAVAAVLLGAPVQRRWRADALYGKAVGAEQLGKRDEARQLLEEALALVPRYAEARAKLAALLLAEQDARRAREELDRAIADDPRCLEARLLRGDLLRRTGDLEPALADFEAAAREAENDPRPAYGKGAALAKRGRWPEAAAELSRGLELQRAATRRPFEIKEYRDALAQSGEAHFQAGEYTAAQTDLEELVRFETNDPAPRVLLGRTLTALGKDAAAIEAFTSALACKPDDAEAIELRACARRRLAHPAEALADLKGDANAKRPRSRLVRGLIYAESLETPESGADFDYEHAKVELEGALEGDGKSLEKDERVRALLALAWVELGAGGEATVAAGRHPARIGRALERLDRAAELAPEDLGVRLTRGLLLARSARPERAKPDLEKARAKKELAYAATFGLAKVALAAGQTDEALALATSACELDTSRPAAHALRSRILQTRGDMAGARAERGLAAANLGAEWRAPSGPPVLRLPLIDVVDPLEAAERASARGIDYYEASRRDGRGSFQANMARAASWLRRAFVLDDDRAILAAKLGDALYLGGDAKAAHAAYLTSLALDPLLLEADIQRGILERDFPQIGVGASGAAQTLASVVERASRPAPDGDPSIVARARYELARALDDANETDQALAAAELAVANAPTRHAAVALRARLLTRLHRDGAHEASRAAARLLHASVEPALVARAQLFLRAAEWRERENDNRAAIHFYTRATEADPTCAQAWRSRGSRYFRSSPYEFAQAFIDTATAIELDPTLGHFFHQDIENNVYRYRRLAEEFEERVADAVGSAPDLASARFLGGFWALVHEDLAKAIEHFDAAIDLAPDWYLPVAYRAEAKLRRDDIAGAEADLAAARKIFRKDAFLSFIEAGILLKKEGKDACYAKLEECVKQGFRWPDTMRSWPSIAAVQETDRLDRILESMGATEDGWLGPRPKKKR